jgi:GMP synthase (glutamine-hydrolysing)
MYGVQFHPEVTHTPEGQVILGNFVLKMCGAKREWSMASFLTEAVEAIRRTVGDSHVIGAVSGGVDSSVAAVLLHR